MKICVVGAGYVGLVTGTCLAESGNDVMMVDIDEEKVRRLSAGISPIYEPSLEELLKRNLAEKRLSFGIDLAAAVRASAIVFVAVGTPASDDGRADLAAFFSVIEDIGRAMDGYRVIVHKSTVPVGTADRVARRLAEITSHPFAVVSNPEFLKEGAAVDDFMRPDRIVIGSEDPRAVETLKSLYAPFVRTENPLLVMDTRSAEMTKYAANAMLASRISFINEVANLCQVLGADVNQVRRGIGSDRRIGYPFLFPGVGFGGSCFPKDLAALEAMGRQCNVPTEIISAVCQVNRRQRDLLVGSVLAHYDNDLSGKVLAVWGLAFKPRTDDMREAPSVTVIGRLLESGAVVRAYDPVARANAANLFGDRVTLCDINYQCLDQADGLVIVTEWNEFRHPDFEKMKSLMRQPVIFDGRNLYDPAFMRTAGFTYYAMGRPPVRP